MNFVKSNKLNIDVYFFGLRKVEEGSNNGVFSYIESFAKVTCITELGWQPDSWHIIFLTCHIVFTIDYCNKIVSLIELVENYIFIPCYIHGVRTLRFRRW